MVVSRSFDVDDLFPYAGRATITCLVPDSCIRFVPLNGQRYPVESLYRQQPLYRVECLNGGHGWTMDLGVVMLKERRRHAVPTPSILATADVCTWLSDPHANAVDRKPSFSGDQNHRVGRAGTYRREPC